MISERSRSIPSLPHPPPRFELAAGGIVFRVRGRRKEIGFILDPFKKWIFPKGHVEKGESTRIAAKRESEEEMGLRGLRVIAYLGKIDLRFIDRYRPESRGARIHKPVHYFLLQAPSGERGSPQRVEKVYAVQWVPIARAVEFCSYKNVRPLIQKAIGMIASMKARPATPARLV